MLYVLLFHVDQDGEEEEEGIFSCHDEDEDGSPLSFIIAFCRMFCRRGGGGVEEGYSWHLQLAHKVPDSMAKSIVPGSA